MNRAHDNVHIQRINHDFSGLFLLPPLLFLLPLLFLMAGTDGVDAGGFMAMLNCDDAGDDCLLDEDIFTTKSDEEDHAKETVVLLKRVVALLEEERDHRRRRDEKEAAEHAGKKAKSAAVTDVEDALPVILGKCKVCQVEVTDDKLFECVAKHLPTLSNHCQEHVFCIKHGGIKGFNLCGDCQKACAAVEMAADNVVNGKKLCVKAVCLVPVAPLKRTSYVCVRIFDDGKQSIVKPGDLEKAVGLASRRAWKKTLKVKVSADETLSFDTWESLAFNLPPMSKSGRYPDITMPWVENMMG